jgi:hypothetical protein
MRRALLAALTVLACLVAPALAAAYGTATTYLGSASATLGGWSNIPGAQAADGAEGALAEGLPPPQSFPANRDFATDASGWTESHGSCVLVVLPLCTVSGGWNAANGGSISSEYAQVVGVLSLGSVTSTLRSDPFTWNGGTAATLGFSVDTSATLSGVNVARADWAAELVDTGTSARTALAGGSVSSTTGWTTSPGTPPAAALQDGHTYVVELKTTFVPLLNVAGSASMRFDNVTLSATSAARRADAEADVTGVPAGSTQTLELRARTSAEAFGVSVWDGSAWHQRLTVGNTALPGSPASYGLTPAEWNGGAVRVRFTDGDQTTADTTQDVLSIDYLRIVSTGGVTVSGPTSATLPAVALDGVSAKTTSAALGAVDVTDSGGVASGWSVSASAGPMALVADPTVTMPATAFSVAPAAPITLSGDPVGVAAGAGGTLAPGSPVTLASAPAGHGVGSYRETPQLSLLVPPNALRGSYQSLVTITVS